MRFVSADLPVSTKGPDLTPQPPHFGVIDSGADPYVILWDNGVSSSAIPGTIINDLYAVSANSRTTYFGRVVAIANESPEYQGVVVAMYRRGSAVAAEAALVCDLTSNTYREVLVSQLAVVGGR